MNIQKLIKLANYLDEIGEYNLANQIDKLIKTSAYFPSISFMRLKKIKNPEELLKDYDANSLITQEKIDGFKIEATKDGSGIKLLTRRGKDVSKNVPEVINELNKLPHGTTILGELTVLVNGKQNISTTQTLLGSKEKTEVDGDIVYYVYDILSKNGKNLTKLPWAERDRILRATVKSGKYIKLVKNYEFKDWKIAEKNALTVGGEGIVIKAKNSTYNYKARGGSEPTGEWWKFKPKRKNNELDVLLTDYTLGEPDPKGFRKAVFTAYAYKGKKLIEVARVSGMSHEEQKELIDMIDNGKKPIVEVGYQDLTKDLRLRHISWHRIRFDKNQPNEIDS